MPDAPGFSIWTCGCGSADARLLCAPHPNRSGSHGMNEKTRRVITGHDKNGKAVVLEDGLAPAVRSNPLRPGHISVDLWKTAATPHILHATEPDPTGGPEQLPRPP